MAKTTDEADGRSVTDYRYGTAKRKNNPYAGLASQGRIAEGKTATFAYNPHLPPVLRFDRDHHLDTYHEILEAARERRLTADEVETLAKALQAHQPWLEWAGKQEQGRAFTVDVVPLHIHERVAAKAIVAVAARQDVQRSLFADPELEYRKAVQFYQHDVTWSNRLILGDSLQVMTSLAYNEDLAGKVQMIYFDPPYGIKFASNFQPQIGQRNVTDRPADLTREPEVVKAYRDTWTLGIHSYLAYLRDRFIVARELLAETGSIFVQIGDENVHLVRQVMDEVFSRENFVSLITFKTTSSLGGDYLGKSCDYVLWYGKDVRQLKFRQIFRPRGYEDDVGARFTRVELADGTRRFLTTEERNDIGKLPKASRIYRHDNLTSQSGTDKSRFPVTLAGNVYLPGNGHWKTNVQGMARLAGAERIAAPTKNSLTYVRFLDDFPFMSFSNVWTDTQTGAFTEAKVYVVQTNTKVIERCLLMTTDPGDLVLDPTCGSGTTAYVAEQWGRRWITIDTSRVAITIARQRLLTATFDYYKLRDEEAGPAGGFIYKKVPHITLKSIAQNQALDPIFEKHAPILAEKLASLNAALAQVPPELRSHLALKLAQKEKAEGRRSITEADRRRWLLPRNGWQDWEVPYDTDPDWPKPLQDALLDYRAAWRAKMDEVNACIAANAEQEELVNQPEKVRDVVRVSGPFTVEAVLPPVESLDAASSPIDELDEELPTFEDRDPGDRADVANAEAYLSQMIQLLRADGVRFPNNKTMHFARLEPIEGDILHAEGEWASENGDANGHPRRVAVSFGPQFGPVTARQVEECLRIAYRRGYDDLVFAGFSFDAEAQATIQEDTNPRVRTHLAYIAPDVNMGDLLKQTKQNQLFTVFGLPRTRIEPTSDGQWVVTMEGVDIYDPVENKVESTSAEKVAAWFLDSDYDGQVFCICQAFFPDKSAWDKLARDLKGVIDPDAFAHFSGTKSLPFPAGEHRRVAVKVIDPRGNEVLRVHRLDGEAY